MKIQSGGTRPEKTWVFQCRSPARVAQNRGGRFGQGQLSQNVILPPHSRRDGTLTVVTGGAFSMNLEMMRPVLLERVNLYFGYTAVTRIRIVQT